MSAGLLSWILGVIAHELGLPVQFRGNFLFSLFESCFVGKMEESQKEALLAEKTILSNKTVPSSAPRSDDVSMTNKPANSNHLAVGVCSENTSQASPNTLEKVRSLRAT